MRTLFTLLIALSSAAFPLRAATDFFVRNGQLNLTLANDGLPAYQLSLTRGAAALSFDLLTTAGAQTPPSAATQFTLNTTLNQRVSWISPPLNSVTITGTVTFNLWAYESAATVNAGITAELLRLDLYGNILSVIAAVVAPATELGLSPGSAQNWAVAPVSTALASSDRLGLRVYRGNVGAMAAGSMTLRAGGPAAAADGDSYVRVTEALSELPAPIGAAFARNWDAEAGLNSACTLPPTVVGVPGWTTLAGNFTVANYCANYINTADPGPPARGAQFFMGGNSAGGTVTYDAAIQSLDVSSRAAFIDAGGLNFDLNAWIGGNSNQLDRASLTLAQVDGSGNTLTSVALGPVTAADRANVTSLLFRQVTGAIQSGVRSLRLLMEFFYGTGPSTDGYIDNVSLTLIPNPGMLPEAVDNLGLAFTCSSPPWYYQTASSFSGGDAARAGTVGDNQSSWMECSLLGPGQLDFYWACSSEANYDFITFYVDGAQLTRTSGTVAWTNVAATLGPGFHTARWTYSKDPNTSAGQDTAWVDRITLTAATPTPSPTALPAFSCLPGACGPWGTIGNAELLSGGYVLTQAIPNQAGGAFMESWLDLAQPFDQSYELFLGSDASGGEGVAFVLHRDPRGYYAMGQSGQYLGYGGAGAISPSLAVEIDTHSQLGNGDLASHHMAIDLNGSTSHNGAGPVPANPLGGSILDGRTHTLRVTWDPVAKKLNAYFDGSLRLSYAGDIVNTLFSGIPCVYWGFSGSTSASAYNAQVMRPLGCANPVQPDLCAAAWSLNGPGAAGTAASGITLTAALNSQAGSSFSSLKVDLLGPFDYSFLINLGNPGGADGMAFVLQNDPRGAAALGGLGGALGYGDSPRIRPSVA